MWTYSLVFTFDDSAPAKGAGLSNSEREKAIVICDEPREQRSGMDANSRLCLVETRL